MDAARILSQQFAWKREFEILEEFTRALRGKPSSYALNTDLSRARAVGKPYDPERIQLFNEMKVALANSDGEFRTDQVAIWLTELGLNYQHVGVIEAHADFFNSSKRLAALKALLKAEDSPGAIRLKLLAVCAGSEVRGDSVLEHLLCGTFERQRQQDQADRTQRTGHLPVELQLGAGYSRPPNISTNGDADGCADAPAFQLLQRPWPVWISLRRRIRQLHQSECFVFLKLRRRRRSRISARFTGSPHECPILGDITI